MLKREDDLHNDILHKFELEKLSYSERCRLATVLVNNRKDRRYYKDHVEELEPIINHMKDPVSIKAINILKQLLGEVRKVEKYHRNRTYTPRVMKTKDM